MAYESFDPREVIRTQIGTNKATNPDDWEEQKVLTITHQGISYDIPMYMSEESLSKELPTLPFIDMNLMRVDYDPHDIGATTRKHEAYLDIGVYFTQSDEIDATTFGKAIVDELLNQLRTNQDSCAFTGINYLYLRNVRLLKQDNEKQVVYQYVIEVYCIYYD